jgi:hypothetical protein
MRSPAMRWPLMRWPLMTWPLVRWPVMSTRFPPAPASTRRRRLVTTSAARKVAFSCVTGPVRQSANRGASGAIAAACSRALRPRVRCAVEQKTCRGRRHDVAPRHAPTQIFLFAPAKARWPGAAWWLGAARWPVEHVGKPRSPACAGALLRPVRRQQGGIC